MKKIATILVLILSSQSYAYWAVSPKVGSLEVTCKYTEINPEVLINFYNAYLAQRGYAVHSDLPYNYYARRVEGKYAITTYRKVGMRKVFVAVFEDKAPCVSLVKDTL